MQTLTLPPAAKLLRCGAVVLALSLAFRSSHLRAQVLAHEEAAEVSPAERQSATTNATGTGTANKIARWTSSTALGNSIITQINGKIGIGNANPPALLTVDGKDPAAATIRGVNTSSGNGVAGTSASGTGVAGTSKSGIAVRGIATGANNPNAAILGQTSSEAQNASGVTGQVTSSFPNPGTAGVRGINNIADGGGYGVHGIAEGGVGVRADGYIGIEAYGVAQGIRGTVDGDGERFGVFGEKGGSQGSGVFGRAFNASGVLGVGVTGVEGYNPGGGAGVVGESVNGTGVAGKSTGGSGVTGQSTSHYGVYGISTNSFAGYFQGKVHVAGTLSKAAGSFEIDHPLDPANKLLAHSFVESPDMMNIYNGNVELDAKGEATVKMPDYFAALNQDYRYQLTAIGAPCPNLYVAEEIKANRFRIAGGKAGSRVSWQVTGVRHDAYANANRIAVEKNKSAAQVGRYLHPELFGQPAEPASGKLPAPALGSPEPERVAVK